MPPDLAHLPPERVRQLESALEVGETVLWAGQPSLQPFKRRAGVLVAIYYGVPLLFAILCLVLLGRMRHDIYIWLLLLSVPVLLLGFWYIDQLRWAARVEHETVYAVTNRGALVLKPDNARRLSPPECRNRLCRPRRGGQGDLYFAALAREVRDIDSGDYIVRDGFLGIPAVQEVDDLLRRTFEEGSERH